MNSTPIETLLKGYLDGSASEQEMKELFAYLRKSENREQLQKAISEALANNSFAGLADESRAGILFQNIMQKAAALKKNPSPLGNVYAINTVGKLFTMRRVAAASVAILILFTGVYFLFSNANE